MACELADAESGIEHVDSNPSVSRREERREMSDKVDF